jgi:1L-myo-inositol 1-phosphate cytidylyltransferase / CDP-L-myo-inositol myo-inositolphosphotransferase
LVCRVKRDERGTIIPEAAIVFFPDTDSAVRLVAGVPWGARIVHQLALAGYRAVALAAPGGARTNRLLNTEFRRLAPGVKITFGDEEDLFNGADPGHLLVSGTRLCPVEDLERQSGSGIALKRQADHWLLADLRGTAEQIAEQGKAIVAATAKPGDGIVARHINRPISRAISRQLLHWPAIRPSHATAVCAALALAMIATLLQGTATTLLAGALLFQACSILDGVDGEIARATFRSTPSGQTLDSLVDGATNVGFIAGVCYSMFNQGFVASAYAGSVGLLAMACGLAVIAVTTHRTGHGVNFDGIKQGFLQRESVWSNLLVWITMRDFYAFVGALLVAIGLAEPALFLFAATASGWFVVVITVLLRRLV